MLYDGGGSDQAGSRSDPFKTTVIDTMVAEIQSVPGEDRCVLLLGYTDKNGGNVPILPCGSERIQSMSLRFSQNIMTIA
jgi:hypothetical protein